MRKLFLLSALILCFSLILSGCTSHVDNVRSNTQPVVVINQEESTITFTPAPKTINPSKQQYVLNTNTKKFHYPSCSSVKQMKEKNKQIVTWTRQEIINQGYSPCGRCHP